MADRASMKITALEISNFMRISAVRFEPGNGVVEITGKNAQGKTSVLNAIWALAGGKAAIPGKPVRKGQKHAVIKAALGDLIVTRKFSEKDGAYPTSVTVETADGAKYSRPQEILNGFVGAISFDPLALIFMKPKDQFDTFRQFVTGVDLDAIAAANDGDFQLRTEVNRRAKSLRAQADGVEAPEDAPDKPIDEGALVDRLQQAGEKNAELERQHASRASKTRDIEALRDIATEWRGEAAELRRRADELEEQAAGHEKAADEKAADLKRLASLPDPVPLAGIRAELETARAHNARYEAAKRARDDVTRFNAEAEKAETESKALTEAIASRNDEVAKAIAASKMPVDGISFGDGVILLNDLPFSQASQAEQLRASVAVAAALNPTLRMALVRQRALLDEDSWKLLCDLAAEHDFQIFVETVASDRPGAIVIEDGHLQGVEPPQDEPAEAAE